VRIGADADCGEKATGEAHMSGVSRALRRITKPCKACGRDFYHLVHWGLTEDIVAHTYRVAA
jgi:hypothetical protein